MRSATTTVSAFYINVDGGCCAGTVRCRCNSSTRVSRKPARAPLTSGSNYEKNNMQVRIGDTLYDADKQPIMLVLSDLDRQQIAAMPAGLHRFCVFPADKFDKDTIQQWMESPLPPPNES